MKSLKYLSPQMRQILRALEENVRNGEIIMESEALYKAIGKDMKSGSVRGIVCRTLRTLQQRGLILCIGRAYMLLMTLEGHEVSYTATFTSPGGEE